MVLFVVREGHDPVAGADRVMLAAMGMPGGGIIQVGATHVLVSPRQTEEPNALLLGAQAISNAGLAPGSTTDVKRRVLPSASRVMLAGSSLPADPRDLLRALQGRPLTTGDTVTVAASYLKREEDLEVAVVEVTPPAAVVAAGTRFVSEAAATGPPPTTAEDGPEELNRPSTAEALVAGLDVELEVLTGWLKLLTSPEDLPKAWGLPQVAGVILEGPTGCGKSELVRAAADSLGVAVHAVNVNLVFKPQRLLDLLEQALSREAPGVVYLDRLEAVAGGEGLAPYRTQVAAILRWFLDAVAGRPGLACVLAVASISHLDESVTKSELLPRSLSIPPPDLHRRRLLFEAATARVPSQELDYDLLAARSAGFSGSDVMASVVHATALMTHRGGLLTTELVVTAIEQTAPSLGSIPAGDIPSYGFEEVAELVGVKQRLTESVIWPITDPERFTRLGIDPPKGVLLFGPPGTGKTFVVRAVAHESGAAFFAVKGAELLDKFVGESERGVREVFSRARSAAPSLLFFDEFDALAPVRGRSTTTVMDSVVAALLTELDGVSERGDISVVAATNRRDLIDPALLRPGRFEVQLELGLPELEARLALLQLSPIPFSDDVDLEQLAALSEGLSFADLDGVLREAALAALRADATALTVSPRHLLSALKRFGAAES